MADSSDSESSSSTPENNTHEIATGDPQTQPRPRGDSRGETDDDDDSDSSSSRDSSPSDNSPSASRLTDLETQQKERVEAKDLVTEANRQQAAIDRLEEAKKLEEEEAQARRREFVEPAAPTTGYACGDCNATLFLSLEDPVRCRVCGCRILYKKRTNRLVYFQSPFLLRGYGGAEVLLTLGQVDAVQNGLRGLWLMDMAGQGGLGWVVWFWKINAIWVYAIYFREGQAEGSALPLSRILGCPKCYILHHQWRVSA